MCVFLHVCVLLHVRSFCGVCLSPLTFAVDTLVGSSDLSGAPTNGLVADDVLFACYLVGVRTVDAGGLNEGCPFFSLLSFSVFKGGVRVCVCVHNNIREQLRTPFFRLRARAVVAPGGTPVSLALRGGMYSTAFGGLNV